MGRVCDWGLYFSLRCNDQELPAPRNDKGMFPSLFRFYQKWFLLRLLWETLKFQVLESCPQRSIDSVVLGGAQIWVLRTPFRGCCCCSSEYNTSRNTRTKAVELLWNALFPALRILCSFSRVMVPCQAQCVSYMSSLHPLLVKILERIIWFALVTSFQNQFK